MTTDSRKELDIPFPLRKAFDDAVKKGLSIVDAKLRKQLTVTRWKDGIDIDYPTPELFKLAGIVWESAQDDMNPEISTLKSRVAELEGDLRGKIQYYEDKLARYGNPSVAIVRGDCADGVSYVLNIKATLPSPDGLVLIVELPELQQSRASIEANPDEPKRYLETIPDHCDRIIWRGRYYMLPLKSEAELQREIEAAVLREALAMVEREDDKLYALRKFIQDKEIK